MPVLIVLLIMILILFLLSYKSLKDTKKFASDELLNEQTENLLSNDEICKEIQEMVESKCEIKLDDKAKSSAYIFFLNKIILSNTEESRKNYTRVMFIAHECVHSVQDKVTHIINFAIVNIKNIFDIVLLVLILLGKGNLELISISLLISILSFYYRIILETDAVYRSVIISRKYLEKRNMDNIAEKYEEIVPKTVQGMYFSYIMPILVRKMIFVLLFLIIK